MKLIKNYLYNLSYQVLLILLPIITTPYVTRIFSSNDLGTYAFYNSIATYFLLLAGLGVANYGTRLISQNRNHLQPIFWSIYHLQLLATFLSTLFYVIVIIGLPRMQHPVAFLFTISLISKGLDISWLFQGLEDFRRITIRNTLVKIFGVASIFLFVKSSDDLVKYVFFLVIFEALGQLSMWIPAKKYIGKWMWDWKQIQPHIKPIILLFVPQIAVTLYVSLDQTMLGVLAGNEDVGLYDQANKILKILLTVVTSLGTVMLPRISGLIADQKEEEVNRLYNLSFLVYNLVIFPMILGMLVINEDFISIFLGPDFQKVTMAIGIMIWRIFFIGWTNIMGIQILIPRGKNKEYMISTTVPAVFSMLLNLVLIPYLGFIGAAITSVLSESLVWFIQLYATREQLFQLSFYKSLWRILLASILMFAVLIGLKTIVHFSSLLNIMIYVSIGAVTYAGGLYILKAVNLKELRLEYLKK
ncbi:flippase [Streptococcus danieliae]|nr:flippase [Streptococcus danieliae]